METVRNSWLELEEALRRQIRLMDEYAELQLEIRHAMDARDWPGLEQLLRSLEEKTRELAEVEETRERLWEESCAEVHADPSDSFYAVTLRLPEDTRAQLAELRQGLRLSSLNLKGVNQALAVYVQTAGSLIQAYLKEVLPELKGSLYGRGGELRGGHRVSMVLNTHI